MSSALQASPQRHWPSVHCMCLCTCFSAKQDPDSLGMVPLQAQRLQIDPNLSASIEGYEGAYLIIDQEGSQHPPGGSLVSETLGQGV